MTKSKVGSIFEKAWNASRFAAGQEEGSLSIAALVTVDDLILAGPSGATAIAVEP